MCIRLHTDDELSYRQWIINFKGFWSKQLWPNGGIVLEFASKDYQNVQNISARISGIVGQDLDPYLTSAKSSVMPLHEPRRHKHTHTSIYVVYSDHSERSIYDMDVCIRLFYVYAVLCVGRGLVTSWSPVQGLHIGSQSWKSGQGRTKECRAIDELMNTLNVA
jgi:hypothetical protein